MIESSEKAVDQFINYLDVCADLTSSHQSAGPWGTSWICSRDNGRVVKNDENSASDATARLAIAFFMAAQNPELTNDQRSLLGERAMNITKFAMQEEFVSGCFNSTVNTSADLCNWRLAGAAQAYGIAAIEQVGQQMFSGYHESDIAHLLAACAYSGNITYCERAADETHQFLHFVEFDNQGNTSAHFNYTTGGAHYYFICSSSGCVPATQSGSTQMDDADSPRLWETCHNVDYARLTYSRLGLGLPWEFQALDNYCDAWTERMGPTGNVATGGQVYANLTSACYRLDDSGGDCDSTGIIGLNSYRPAGWVSNMVGFLSNESYYNTFATGTLSTYNIADDVYSGDTGFGIYGQVRYIRSIRSATGFYDFLYTNQTFNYTGYTQGTGSNGTQGASEGGGGGESAKSGLVSTTRGTTPFYVLEANPQNSTSCLNSNLTDTDQCTIVWTVNATGGFGVEHTFFSYYSSEYSTQQNSANYLINISSTAAPVVGAGGVGLNITLCPNISNTQPLWYANVTRALNGRGGYDPVNKLYNESYILPLNNTLCGWTWKVNNTNTTSAKTVSFTTNISNSDRNWTFYVNHTMFNTTAKTYSVPASTVYYFNVSLNYTRLPVLQGEPSVNVTVVEA